MANKNLSLKSNIINEKLIILALFFSPFTQLRIGFIGLTEVLMLLFSLRIISVKTHKINIKANDDYFIFTKFWVLFILISILGTGYNYIIMGHISGQINTFAIDFSSYIVIFFVCFSLETLIYNSKSLNIQRILKMSFIYSSLVFLILYLVSMIFGNIFGLPLLYYNFFRPFANNIHHTAMSIAPLPFLGLKLMKLERKKIKKIPYILLITSNVVIANATGSLKVTLGLIVGLLVFILISILIRFKSSTNRLLLVMLALIIFTTIAYVYFEPLKQMALDLFTEEDIGGGRQILWSSSISKIMDSPLIGYGPGAHASYFSSSFSDAHQTLLTLGLQAGILGIILYLVLNYKIFRKIYIDPYIVASYTGIMLYALGGDILRRIPMWIFLILFYYSINNNQDVNNESFIDIK